MKRAHSRRAFVRNVAALSGALPVALARTIQPGPGPVRRIGYLASEGFPDLLAAFTQELAVLGYNEGRDLVIEARLVSLNAGDPLAMAAELARQDLALIVAAALPHAIAVRRANPAMPMVIATCPGMVSNGFAATLERPGGLYTGIDELPPGVTGRRLKLLKTAAPAVSRVALLSTTPGRGGHETQVADAEAAAPALGVQVTAYRAISLAELQAALERIAADRMNGLLTFQGSLSLVNRRLIVDFVTSRRIPAIYQATRFVDDAGGLMAWAPDLVWQYRQAARFVDEILKGGKPADLPIKHAERYELIVNRSAATKIGLTLPETLVAQAARVVP